ncbi:hypothetical protein ACJX0J_036590 [Zea mays]
MTEDGIVVCRLTMSTIASRGLVLLLLHVPHCFSDQLMMDDRTTGGNGYVAATHHHTATYKIWTATETKFACYATLFLKHFPPVLTIFFSTSHGLVYHPLD